jgi:hypothetical protein
MIWSTSVGRSTTQPGSAGSSGARSAALWVRASCHRYSKAAAATDATRSMLQEAGESGTCQRARPSATRVTALDGNAAIDARPRRTWTSFRRAEVAAGERQRGGTARTRGRVLGVAAKATLHLPDRMRRR